MLSFEAEAMRVYLDHNATTPVDPPVADLVDRVLREEFGNASSVHSFGQRAKTRMDDARESLATLLGAEPAEIVFTSGGTEADNLAVRGIADLFEASPRRHLIASSIEHEAILNTLKVLGKRGWRITLLPVDQSGIVSPDALATAIGDDTALVSVMHANNEIGTIQPIETLAAIAHEHGALFHTDAVQSIGKIPVDVQRMHVDMLSLSGHKCHAPKGVGALWLRRGTKLLPTATGGRQERNRRAGTENVPGIAGLGEAARLARARLDSDGQRVRELRDYFEQRVLDLVTGTVVNGARETRVPNTSNISFEGVEAESLLIALDLEGIAVSTGSACSSGTLQPSHVLKAMGLSSRRIQSAIRFSLGKTTTRPEIDRVLEVLPSVVERLRSLSHAGAAR